VKQTLVLLIVLLSPLAAFSLDFHEIGNGHDTIYFESGLEGGAQRVLSMIPRLKGELKDQTGLALSTPFGIVLVRKRADFIQMVGSDLVSAIAIPGRRLIVVDLSRMSVHPLNLELMLKHEMCHLLLHTNITAGSFPRWFDEGVCEWVSGGMNEIVSPESGSVLRRAAVSGRLIPFHALSVTFPADGTMFSLAYEQSLDMIEFLSEKHGGTALQDILAVLHQGGKTFPEAVGEVTGSSLDDLEKEWRESLLIKYTWISYVLDNIVWIVFVFGALLTACGFWRYRIRMKAYPGHEGDETDDDPSLPQP